MRKKQWALSYVLIAGLLISVNTVHAGDSAADEVDELADVTSQDEKQLPASLGQPAPTAVSAEPSAQESPDDDEDTTSHEGGAVSGTTVAPKTVVSDSVAPMAQASPPAVQVAPVVAPVVVPTTPVPVVVSPTPAVAVPTSTPAAVPAPVSTVPVVTSPFVSSPVVAVSPTTPSVAPMPTTTTSTTVTPLAPAVVSVPTAATVDPLVAPVSVPTSVPATASPIIEKGGGDQDELERGIESLSLGDDSGNWILKRQWFESGEDKYNRMTGRVEELWKQLKIFSNQRAMLEQQILTPFYVGIGVDQGTLNTILTDLMEEINRIKKKTMVLSDQERELVEVVGADQKSLEQLKEDIALIEEIDVKVDEALDVLTEQIKLCRTYEMEAWKYLQEIAKTLSDKKARTLHSYINVMGRNISNIITYVQRDFTRYFDQLIALAKSNTERVKQTMAMLREKGVDFQQRAQVLKDLKEGKKPTPEKATMPVREDEEEEDEVQPVGWMSWIVGSFRSVFDAVVNGFTSAYHAVVGWFSSTKEDTVPETPSGEAVQGPEGLTAEAKPAVSAVESVALAPAVHESPKPAASVVAVESVPVVSKTVLPEEKKTEQVVVPVIPSVPQEVKPDVQELKKEESPGSQAKATESMPVSI